ncbi:kinase-like domain-containing protein [Russula emetica]|nr:kinase-like domain-containing protein [Russula emetica]
MRLYKQKDIPKPPRSTLDCPPGLPSPSPASTTPDRFRRAAEAVSKQISGHKAMVAQFKDMKLPRPPMFSTKPATSTKSDLSHSLPPTQSKSTKRSKKPQTVPGRSSNPKAPTSAASLKQRPVLSNVDTNLPSLTRPPGLGSEKTTPPASKPSAPRTAPKMPQSVQSPIQSSMQKAGAKPSTSPFNDRASTGADLASVSVTSAPTQVDVDEPILFVSCFHSLEEDDPEIEDDELLQTVEVTSDFESQVAQIFGVGLGYVSEDEVVKHGEIASPKVTPEPILAPTLEPMSAVVEWWEPATVNPAIESDVAMAVKSKGETDGFETNPLDQNQVVCMPSTDISRSSLSLACRPSQPTSVVRIDIPRQPPSSADFEFVASLCSGAPCSIALCIHKQSRRQCAVKIISNAVLEDQRIVRAVLAEQRIMREVSRYPFLLGLLASFRGVHGLYLVSEYCCSTLFDGRFHMPESYKKLAFAELACAVNHLHSLGIIHRDIKLENVMVKNDGHVVLGDFDLAVRLETASSPAPRPSGSLPGGKSNALKTRGVCGTLPYMAPEVLRNMEYSYGVDWFSYGVFLHVFYLDKFPWLGEYEHPVSYLKEMMSTISLGVIFRNGMFGDLLKKLFCVDQDGRADFSVVRRAPFFADFEWQKLISMDSTASCLSNRPMSGESPQYSIESDPYSEFTWLNPSMIVEEATPDVGGAPESAIAKYYTSSDFDAPSSGRSPDSSCDLYADEHVLRNSVRSLDGGEDPIFSLPAVWIAAFGDSGTCLDQGTGVPPAREDDEAVLRTSIRSLDIGEEPVLELPSGWKEACVSASQVAVPSLSQQPEVTRKTSVLPKIKSLWKRATSKFSSRRV